MRFVVEVDEDFHQRVKLEALREGIAVSEVIRKLLSLWLNGLELDHKPTKKRRRRR